MSKEEFIEWMQLKNFREKTIKVYLFYHDKFNTGKDITQDRVNRFLRRYKNNVVVRAFINNYLSFIVKYKSKDVHNILEIKEISLEKITSKPARKIPKVLNEFQVKTIERGFKDEKGKIMLLISFYGGLRVGELVNIRPYSFNWDEWELEGKKLGRLKVIGKGDIDRIVLLPTWLMERIELWIKEFASVKENDRNKRLFAMGERRWQQLISRAAKKTLGYHVHPHTLRHSCATHLYNKDWKDREVQEYLGHKDISTTQIYVHLVRKDLEEKYEKSV